MGYQALALFNAMQCNIRQRGTYRHEWLALGPFWDEFHQLALVNDLLRFDEQGFRWPGGHDDDDDDDETHTHTRFDQGTNGGLDYGS